MPKRSTPIGSKGSTCGHPWAYPLAVIESFAESSEISNVVTRRGAGRQPRMKSRGRNSSKDGILPMVGQTELH